MPPRAPSTHVPAQYYGYSLQCTHFVLLLLKAEPGTFVSLEVVEDVATHGPSSDMSVVQTKSGQGTNPVSDSSIELWKTFFNWKQYVEGGQLKIGSTHFELHVATPRTGQIVKRFSEAHTEQQAIQAIQFARERLLGKAPHFRKRNKLGNEPKAFVWEVLNPTNEHILRGIVTNFSLTTGSGKAFDDLLGEFKRALVDEDIAEDVLLQGLGWVKKKLDELIEQKKAAIIAVDEFRNELLTFRNKLKARNFLPSFAGASPSPEQIAANKLSKYVRQLQFISWDEESTLKAISDFLSTEKNIIVYSERGYLHRSSLTEFEDSLRTLWKNLKDQIEIETSPDPVKRGRLLALRCLQQRRRIEGLEVPDDFLPGCYHALADFPKIGWHPDYKDLLSGGTAQ